MFDICPHSLCSEYFVIVMFYTLELLTIKLLFSQTSNVRGGIPNLTPGELTLCTFFELSSSDSH